MDPIRNPYSMGAGNPPAVLTGRERELEQVETLLHRLSRGRSDQSLIVSGLRGVGKTVLLLECWRVADRLGWVAPDPLEIKSDTDFRAELAELAYQALVRLDRRVAIGERLRSFTRVLQAFKVGATSAGQIEFSFDAEAVERRATGNLERDLTELLTDLGEVARDGGTGVLFLIDEMQFLKRDELEALAAAMHRMSQRQLPVALVGAGLPQLPGLLVEAKSYSERLFAYPHLDRLSEDDARKALELPAEAEDVEFEPSALTRLVELSGRYPAFLQAYGKEAWNTAPASPITAADVAAIEPLVRDRLDDEFFHVRFERATRTERRYMSAMASLGGGPYATADVAAAMGYPRTAGGSVHRDALIKKGLIFSPDHGLVDFSVPHFAPFMRRRYPFEQLRLDS